MKLLRKGITPSRIITRKAMENAVAGVMATGGSTNAVLHLLAVAREAGVRFKIDDFDRISRKTPVLANLKPWGLYTGPEMFEAGGMALVARELLKAGKIHGDQLTVSGRTLGAEARRAKAKKGQKVIVSARKPLKKTGGIAILRGSLAPDGCVIKLSGQEKSVHEGPAKVFNREEDAFEAVKKGRIKPNDVIIIRYEGPKGGPGMREMLHVAGAIQGSSTLPTEAQLWQVDRAWEVLPPAVDRLNVIILTRVPTLTAMFDAEGVRPSVGEAIEIPKRQGG